MILPIFIPIENIYCDDLIEEFEKNHSENFGDYSESKENDFFNQPDENHKRFSPKSYIIYWYVKKMYFIFIP